MSYQLSATSKAAPVLLSHFAFGSACFWISCNELISKSFIDEARLQFATDEGVRRETVFLGKVGVKVLLSVIMGRRDIVIVAVFQQRDCSRIALLMNCSQQKAWETPKFGSQILRVDGSQLRPNSEAIRSAEFWAVLDIRWVSHPIQSEAPDFFFMVGIVIMTKTMMLMTSVWNLLLWVLASWLTVLLFSEIRISFMTARGLHWNRDATGTWTSTTRTGLRCQFLANSKGIICTQKWRFGTNTFRL